VTGSWRLAWKLQRWELATLFVFVGVLIVALVAIGWRMEQIQAAAPECWRDANVALTARQQDACSAPYREHGAMSELGTYAAVASSFAPFLLGMILGPPLVGREIEGRTAGIAWALSRSRLRWLVLRAIPVIGVVLVSLVLMGVSGTALARQLAGGEPGFGSLITPLPLLLARGVLSLAIGLVAGVAIGRTFPAILATALVVGLVMAGTSIGIDAWMAAEAEPLPGSDSNRGSKIYNTGLRDDETGEVITLAQYFATPGISDTAEVPPPGMTLVAWRIPATDYAIWMWREAAAVGLVALAVAALFVFVLMQRTP
jgi:hypothetical protein